MDTPSDQAARIREVPLYQPSEPSFQETSTVHHLKLLHVLINHNYQILPTQLGQGVV